MFGPVTLGPLLGVITQGGPVEVTVGDDVITVGVTAEPSDRTPEEVVYTQGPAGTTPDEVLLDGQADLILAEISCGEVTAGIDQSDFSTLLSASPAGDCENGLGRLVLTANETLSEALGVDPLNGGVGAPFELAVDINGTGIQPVVLPGPVAFPYLDGDPTPVITIDGQAIAVDAPSATTSHRPARKTRCRPHRLHHPHCLLRQHRSLRPSPAEFGTGSTIWATDRNHRRSSHTTENEVTRTIAKPGSTGLVGADRAVDTQKVPSCMGE